MRLSHKYQFVFFALPKAGSSSVRQLLNPYSELNSVKNFFHRSAANPFYPHIRPAEARPLFRARGWDFEGYRKFAMTRNPWARMVSLYRHIRVSDPAIEDFRTWLGATAPNSQGDVPGSWERWRYYGAWPASRFLAGADGRSLVDRVIRLEDIGADLPGFLQSLGIPGAGELEPPHVNARRGVEDHRTWYDDESALLVESCFRDDIETWGYEFESA